MADRVDRVVWQRLRVPWLEVDGLMRAEVGGRGGGDKRRAGG